MTLGRLVKCRGDNLGVNTAAHVGHLLGTLVDEQNHDVGLGVVLGDSIGDVFQQDCLTGLGGSHDESALTLADGGEHVDDAGRDIAHAAASQIEFLVGEKRCKVFKSHAVADILGRSTVDAHDACQGEIFLTLARGAYSGIDNVAGAQAVLLDLLLGDIHVVGRGEVVVVA